MRNVKMEEEEDKIVDEVTNTICILFNCKYMFFKEIMRFKNDKMR